MVKEIARDSMLIFFQVAKIDPSGNMSIFGDCHKVLNAFENVYHEGITRGDLIFEIMKLL